MMGQTQTKSYHFKSTMEMFGVWKLDSQTQEDNLVALFKDLELAQDFSKGILTDQHIVHIQTHTLTYQN